MTGSIALEWRAAPKPRERDAAYVSEDATDGHVPHLDAGTVAHSQGVVYVDSEAQRQGEEVADADTAQPAPPDPVER